MRRIDAKNTSAKRITETSWSTSFRVPLERRVCAANAQNTCSTTAITPNLLSKTIYTYNSRGQVLTSTQIDPANASNTRTSTYSYCDVVNTVDCPRIGLTLAIDGPRTDVNDITTNSYRMADGVDYKKGDLWKVTSANGQVNEFLSYDGAGRVLRMLDANLVETELSYHPRGWLTSRTIKGATVGENATTTFTYTPFGAIERVTQADGAYTQYAYDDAQRLTGISDSLGNTISYILDAAGNRLSEQTKDSNNVLKRSLARQYDQLSRLRASLRAGILTTDPDTKKTTYTYDANNNSDLTTDPNISASTGTVTDNDYDPLNRLIQSIQDKATAGINARTQYGYDALDRLISVTDPKNLITSYQYDGLSNLKQLSSPDIGITLYPAYDAAGNRTEQTDARGVKSIMSYDVLNRLIKIEYKPAGSLVINAAKTVQFFYDQSSAITGCSNSFPAGRLTRFTDETGSTTFCYDRRGNVTQKTQSTNGVNFVLAMTYSKADRLLSMSYPSGTNVVYGRDGQGRISSLSVNGSAFITHVSYFPFGPVAQIDFANGRSLVKTGPF